MCYRYVFVFFFTIFHWKNESCWCQKWACFLKYTQIRHLGHVYVFWELKNFHIVLRSIYFAFVHIYDCHRFEEWDRRPPFQVLSALSSQQWTNKCFVTHFRGSAVHLRTRCFYSSVSSFFKIFLRWSPSICCVSRHGKRAAEFIISPLNSCFLKLTGSARKKLVAHYGLLECELKLHNLTLNQIFILG